MRRDVQEGLATVAGVHQLGFGRSPEGKPAKYEGPGVKRKRLLTILSLFADKLDGVKLLESTFRDAENGCSLLETLSDRQKTVALFVREVRTGCIMGCIVVPEWEPRVRMRATACD